MSSLEPILKGCPFKFTLRYSGHRASMPLSQAVPYSPTHNRAMHIHCGGQLLPLHHGYYFRSERYGCVRGGV
nr:MAG TPA: BAF1 / ABF1 chromatin reorganizing factor [Caudoviricetes sp.]